MGTSQSKNPSASADDQLVSFVLQNGSDLPQRTVMDPRNPNQPLQVCSFSIAPTPISYYSCAEDEVYWEPSPLGGNRGNGCVSRDLSYGANCVAPYPPEVCMYHTCSKVTVDDCPIIGNGIKATKATAANPQMYDGHKVSCSYKVSDVASSCEAAADFDRYKKEELGLQTHDNWFEPAVMNKLCAGREIDTDLCPAQSKTFVDADGKPICSKMLTCLECKEWANSTWPGADVQSDNIMKQWCEDSAHKNDPACKCYYRATDKIYLELQSKLPARAGCWYKSCVDQDFVQDLVTSDVRQHTVCPTTICQNVIDVLGGNIDINTLNMEINCTGGVTPPSPGPQPTPTPTPGIIDIIKDIPVPYLVGGGAVGLIILGLLLPSGKKK